MDHDQDYEHEQPGGIRPGAIAAGFILLALGAALFLDRAGLTDVRAGQLVPPFVLIALGTSKILEGRVVELRDRSVPTPLRRGRPRRRGRSYGGLWLIGIGGWMLISQTHLFGLDYGTSWPIFVILAGLMMVIRGIR